MIYSHDAVKSKERKEPRELTKKIQEAELSRDARPAVQDGTVEVPQNCIEKNPLFLFQYMFEEKSTRVTKTLNSFTINQ